jgi:hypothetical protein
MCKTGTVKKLFTYLHMQSYKAPSGGIQGAFSFEGLIINLVTFNVSYAI